MAGVLEAPPAPLALGVFVLVKAVWDPGYRKKMSRHCVDDHGMTYLNLTPSSAEFSSLQPAEQLSKQHSLYLWRVLPYSSKVHSF